MLSAAALNVGKLWLEGKPKPEIATACGLAMTKALSFRAKRGNLRRNYADRQLR